MLLLLAAVVIQWFLYVYIIRYVWNNVLVSTFANLKPIGLASAGFLLLLCRILFTKHVYIPRHMLLTPCEEACADACNGL